MQQHAPLKILKASAGSGKTFSLTLHYITLLIHKPDSYKEILAVTFTNKATAEMKDRILSVLQDLASDRQDSPSQAFKKILLSQYPDWTPDLIQENALTAYRKILHDYNHFVVSTIDSFTQKVIRIFSYELNLDSSYKIEMNMDKVNSDLTLKLHKLLDKNVDLLSWIFQYAEAKIKQNKSWNYLEELKKLAGLIFSENFKQFSSHIELIDKNKLFRLLNEDIKSKNAFFIDKVNITLKSLKEQYRLSDIEADQIKGRSRNPLVSLNKQEFNPLKASISDVDNIIKKFESLRNSEDVFVNGKKKEKLLDVELAFIPILVQIDEVLELRPIFIGYNAIENNLYFIRLLHEMSELLSDWRKENTSLLISDAQMLLYKLGADQMNSPSFIWEKIGNQFNYFLFDEFQDTSVIQWKNYSPLLLNALSQQSEKNLNEHLIVGDVKQSIYRFRNGDWRILLQQIEDEVMSTFRLNESQKDKFITLDTLDTNYRSEANIVLFNNYVYERLPTILQNLLNDQVSEEIDIKNEDWWQTSGNSKLLIKAYENATQKISPKKLESADQGSIEIDYIDVDNNAHRRTKVYEESTLKLCNKIGEWITSKRYKPGQIGILVRENKQILHILNALLEYKASKGMSFDVISGEALMLTSNNAIMLLIQTLRAMTYTSREYAIYLAQVGFLYQTLDKVESDNDQPFDSSYWLKFKSNDIRDLEGLLPEPLITNWNDWQTLPLIHLIEKLIAVYGLTTLHNPHIPFILAFKEEVNRFSNNGQSGIYAFVEYWDLESEKIILPSETDVDAIEILTVHKCKGLDYDVVMIPFCSWDLDGKSNTSFWIDVDQSPFAQLGKATIKYSKPLSKSFFFKQYFEEMLMCYMDALNMLYVATTRAVKHLYISAPTLKDKKNMKYSLISDVLQLLLKQPGSPYALNENEQLHMDGMDNSHRDIETEKENDTSIEHTVTLDRYPISDKADQIIDPPAEMSINDILLMDAAAQYGILAHKIVTASLTLDEANKTIIQYIEDGILAKNQEPLLRDQILKIWNHPQLNSWLNGKYKIEREAAIIMPNGGKIQRPDLVFHNEHEAIVLDFKFTTENHIKHLEQVKRYINALLLLGFTNVKGYLYYALENDLVQVH